ncbi:uncharacterized protein [Spinacia oleracea]|uniref:Endonuclease/exonuclease/phosphatase domain-containing protein n=1 Tax=Spinacia oleracea TaxID=3562 RepID=A0ABM3R385_SPIOL|nr:uncharacterized protein LOC130465099 [Spinacia oleracea]
MFKIVAQIGKPIKRDQATTCRDKLQFARVMIDVPLTQELPEHVSFRDENGTMVRAPVFYEWKPTQCTKCKMMGHLQGDCRQGRKRVWVRKQPAIPTQIAQVTSPIVDQEGFQRSLRPIRVRFESEQPVRTSNAFQCKGLYKGVIQLEEGTLLNLMDRVLAWNVRGLNSTQKQDEVKHFIQKYAVGLVGLLEHKVKLSNLGRLYQRVFANWCFSSNSSFHDGGRIVIAWKSGCFNVNIVAASSQFVHCHVTLELWRDLGLLNTQDPWILCGDFNSVMAVDERIGAPVIQSDIVDISNCFHNCGMEDIKSVGNFFTWNNK